MASTLAVYFRLAIVSLHLKNGWTTGDGADWLCPTGRWYSGQPDRCRGGDWGAAGFGRLFAHLTSNFLDNFSTRQADQIKNFILT